jgi:prepilin-type N-terminal cleavage/methylation domain-containing protein
LRNNHPPSARGFSLLEVLVAVTIFAIIAAVLYSGFAMTTRTWRRGQEKIQQGELQRSVFELIRRQVASVYPVMPLVDEDPQPVDPSQPTFRPTAEKLPYFVGSGGRMAFVSLFSMRLNAIPGLCFVAYSVEPSETTEGFALVEYEKQYTGVNPMGKEEIDALPENIYRYVLLDGLDQATFQFFGADLSQQGAVPVDQIEKDWFDDWDVETMGDLPEAVRIQYRFRPGSRARFLQGEIMVPIHSHGNAMRRRFNTRSTSNVPIAQ